MFEYEVTHTEPSTAARRGRFHTPHGVIETPVFMPVGTAAAVKGLSPSQIAGTGASIILANTYHLMLRPGVEVVRSFGGLHEFMSWNGPILTDSGGFQIFSLAELARVDDNGVAFRSHIDGQALFLDPETAIRVQSDLGADIVMVLDHCPPYPSDRGHVAQAVQRTLGWARQCRALHRRDDQALFGIVQGGVHHDLRRLCAEALCEMEFSGYAIGGLSVGEPFEEMAGVLEALVPSLPPHRPRYLMGVGMPRDIVLAVQHGVDMFDCVLPTRNGRNAYAFTAKGPIKLRNERHKLSREPLEEGCDCMACKEFTRGYIRHLFMAKEMLGPILTSVHNLRFFHRLMSRLRSFIEAGDVAGIYGEFPVAARA